MRSYEGIFFFPPESTPDVRKNQLKSLDDLFSKFKVQITQRNEWGKKQIGYALRKSNEAFILVYDFQMDPAHGNDFRKALEIQEDLMKFMVTLKVEAKPVEKKAAKPASAVSAAPAPKVSKPQAPTASTTA